MSRNAQEVALAVTREDDDLPNSRHHVITFLRAYRVEVIDDPNVSLYGRRLAVYRRAGLQAAWNVDACERRLRRAKKLHMIERWKEAIATWKQVGEYFSERIRVCNRAHIARLEKRERDLVRTNNNGSNDTALFKLRKELDVCRRGVRL